GRALGGRASHGGSPRVVLVVDGRLATAAHRGGAIHARLHSPHAATGSECPRPSSSRSPSDSSDCPCWHLRRGRSGCSPCLGGSEKHSPSMALLLDPKRSERLSGN